MILLLFGLTTVAILVTVIVRMIAQRNRSRDEAQGSGLPTEQRPRTEEEKAADKRTATIWGCAALLVPALLAAAYVVTR